MDLLLFILRSLLLLLPIWIFYYWNKTKVPFYVSVDKIPGPKAWPLVGNLFDLLIKPEELYKRFPIDLVEYGPVFRFWALYDPQVIIMRARDLEVFLQGMAHHVKGASYSFLHPWMGQGLLTSSGDIWRVHRKVLTPAFHFNILHEFLPIFNKHALQMTKCLAAEPKISHPQGFDIFHYSSLCALDIICESSMGTKINAQLDSKSPYVHAVNNMIEGIIKRYLNAWMRPEWIFKFTSVKKKMDKYLDFLNDFTDKVIADRRQYLKTTKNMNKTETKEEDIGSRQTLAFLDLLLAAEEEGSEFMTQKDIRDQVSTFMFEGHDTVSAATSWVLFIMGTYPEYQAKVVEELFEVFGDSGRAPQMSDLANLKYLERCIKEAMRLYPSVSFIERSTLEDAKIENHIVPAGCTVAINIYMLHRDPEFWPEPEKYDPDRFLPENSTGRHPYAYVPFSAGPRNCIGQKFALMEEKVVVSTILRRYRIEAVHTRDELIMMPGLVLKPKGGLFLRLFERETHPKLQVSSLD